MSIIICIAVFYRTQFESEIGASGAHKWLNASDVTAAQVSVCASAIELGYMSGPLDT